MTKDEALKMAIEALQNIHNAVGLRDYEDDALQACKKALKICDRCGKVNPADIHTCTPKEALKQPAKNIRESFNEMLEDKVKYYKKKQATPSWQGLNDDEIQKELKKMWDKGLIPSYSIVAFAKTIEQALKEKNTVTER